MLRKAGPSHLAHEKQVLLLRPHQWIKNTFVAAPLFFTPSAASLGSVQPAILGVLAFCLVASSVYIINDYWDRAADRLHPEKRHRPLATQTVTVLVAAGLMLALLPGGVRARGGAVAHIGRPRDDLFRP